jgi:anhydro-N-acetylmuramic acid kinase
MGVSVPQWLQRIHASLERAERLCLGLMSGTSANGIDTAICRMKGAPESGTTTVELVHAGVVPYPDDVRDILQRQISNLDVRLVAELHARIGEAFADAAQVALKTAQIPARDLDAVGSHGQTVYHHSRQPGVERVTLQLGDGDRLAMRLGAPVFFDFRARDVALGGEGAPLTPYADGVLYGAGDPVGRAVVNLGGIANVTFLAADRRAITGFDVGPANAPLDRIARRLTSGRQSYDVGGDLARKGTVVQTLLEELVAADTFIAAPPPKSTGFEAYGDAFVDGLVARYGGPLDVHVLRTVVEFCAVAIATAVTRDRPAGFPPVREVILAGGGVENPALLEAIAARCRPSGVTVRRSEELGVPSSAREAMAFAIFAHEALLGAPSSLPAVTGARQSAVLGKLCLPPHVRGAA